MTRAVGLAMLLACIAASAATSSRTDPVPLYSPGQFVQGIHRFWALPRADEFAREAADLHRAVGAWCAGGDAIAIAALQARWRSALVAWVKLSAVPIGPLVERRSARAIDFAPTRPASIQQAIATAPRDVAAMERIGGPAKGFGALEWLLWEARPQPDSAGCAYMTMVAAEIEQEAVALQQAFATLAQREWDSESAAVAMSEIVNQWIGAVERLRWASMEKPLRAGRNGVPDYPRRLSGATRAQWEAQWGAIEALAILEGAAPSAGTALIPLEAYLRGRGFISSADALVKAARAADTRIAAVDPKAASRVAAAAASLATLKRTAETRVAPSLKIKVGFSDADGD